MAEGILVSEAGGIGFSNLVGFTMEVAEPTAIKRRIDALLVRLAKAGARHSNRVITRVVHRDAVKRTVTMQAMLPLRGDTLAADVVCSDGVFEAFPEYSIGPCLHASIPNDPRCFKQTVEEFLRRIQHGGLEDYDASRQHIIEVARIDMYGAVLGFDLYMELVER